MATLCLTRGIPGSGKTTEARGWVAEASGRVRLNRDDFRTMMFGGWTGLDEHEDAVTDAQYAAVQGQLFAGRDVVVDDTNLRDEVMARWVELAAAANAELVVWDLTNVPLETCLARNELRAGTPAYVPPEVIRGMWSRYVEPLADAR